MKITRWGILEVSRHNVLFSYVNGIEKNSELLAKILPFGSPTGDSLKHIVIDNTIYFTYLKMDGQEGKGIVFAFDPLAIQENLMGLVPEMANLVENLPQEPYLELNPRITPLEGIQIKNLDVAIFAFLARLKTIILGNEEDVMRIFSAVYRVLPPEMRHGLGFVTQSTSLTENVNIIGMPFSEEVTAQIDQVRGEFTVVIPGDRVYGQFTSAFCKKIANFAAKDQYENITLILKDFFSIVIASDELPSPLEFANARGLHLSDAQLALIMRANHFNKEVPSELLEG